MVSNICEQVRIALLKDFVPKYKGPNHLTREDWFLQNTEMVSELFDLNGTSYCCRCPHKKRNLVKPFVVCASNGKIIDIYGPYGAVDSDSTILNSLVAKNRDLKNLLRDNDLKMKNL
ncbi:unnamed protein product [Brachionus calyciflorus]|uniref:DDE Tnp4 domain-containing protein n=1 Tax=Brachionus calyciflorus TaxID=104777 RepID=A0A814GPT2_9BILA|nr:unnamed protein product [Brachionus calyciflorus]